MTWMELYLLLQSMVKAEHTSLTGTPSSKVTVIIDNEEFYLDLFESMTTGKICFVHAQMYAEETDGN